MALTTQELGRIDVKPYTKFINKVSVNPYTREMTYENVPDFLEVSHILHKQITRYRIHFPFVVEITRIERVPLVPQQSMSHGNEKILGATGRGNVWYDLEVRCCDVLRATTIDVGARCTIRFMTSHSSRTWVCRWANWPRGRPRPFWKAPTSKRVPLLNMFAVSCFSWKGARAYSKNLGKGARCTTSLSWMDFIQWYMK